MTQSSQRVAPSGSLSVAVNAITQLMQILFCRARNETAVWLKDSRPDEIRTVRPISKATGTSTPRSNCIAIAGIQTSVHTSSKTAQWPTAGASSAGLRITKSTMRSDASAEQLFPKHHRTSAQPGSGGFSSILWRLDSLRTRRKDFSSPNWGIDQHGLFFMSSELGRHIQHHRIYEAFGHCRFRNDFEMLLCRSDQIERGWWTTNSLASPACWGCKAWGCFSSASRNTPTMEKTRISSTVATRTRTERATSCSWSLLTTEIWSIFIL